VSCALPNPFHVKRDEALDIATEIVGFIAEQGRLCVYFDSAGAMSVSRRLLDIPGDFSLVGVYDDAASATDIADDIIAMQREHVHGKASA
jgi:hypothetical protein